MMSFYCLKWAFYKPGTVGDYESRRTGNDSISFSKFCGLTLEQASRMHGTLSRKWQKINAYRKNIKKFNRQLEKHQIVIRTGAIIDASVVDTPLKLKESQVMKLPRSPWRWENREDLEKGKKEEITALKPA